MASGSLASSCSKRGTSVALGLTQEKTKRTGGCDRLRRSTLTFTPASTRNLHWRFVVECEDTGLALFVLHFGPPGILLCCNRSSSRSPTICCSENSATRSPLGLDSERRS